MPSQPIQYEVELLAPEPMRREDVFKYLIIGAEVIAVGLVAITGAAAVSARHQGILPERAVRPFSFSILLFVLTTLAACLFLYLRYRYSQNPQDSK